jgi:hypothetical protein
MELGEPYIRLTLDVPEAVELGDFVGTFTALASEFERYVQAQDPKAAGQATLFVREVRQGSIIADLVPWVSMLSGVVEAMDKVMVVEDFVRRYGERIGIFRRPAPLVPPETRSGELRDFAEQVAAIANNPGSSLEIAAIEIEDGDHKVKSAFRFKTSEAREVTDRLEAYRQQIEQRTDEPIQRVLMHFTRTDVGTPAVGQNTGERVKIEALSDRSLPLVYASELAEQRIKHEITEAEDNVYKKGFMVDVVVETRNGRPAAYKVVTVHQVIDLGEQA